jgi:hypothetical protein
MILLHSKSVCYIFRAAGKEHSRIQQDAAVSCAFVEICDFWAVWGFASKSRFFEFREGLNLHVISGRCSCDR